MKVLICGAGIAGLTLAYWLLEDGIEPVVIERAPALPTQGYLIDFAGSGYDVANRMHLVGQLHKHDQNFARILYHNASGQVTAHLNLRQLYNVSNVEGKFFTMDRSNLVKVLHGAVQGRCAIRFDTTIQSIMQDDDGVSVVFADGASERFDVVIGADGIHSQIRALTFGDEQQFAHDLGYHFAIFYVPPVDASLGRDFHIYIEPNTQVDIYPRDQQWMVFAAYRSGEPIPSQNRALALQRHLSGLGWLIPEILAQLDTHTPIFMDTVTQIEMRCWSKGRIALIGDAAYCPTLVSGQGASMAMAGAYLLAQAFKRHNAPADAFAQYEHWLRPHIVRIQDKARSFAPTFIPSNQLRILMTNWAIRLIHLPLVKNLVAGQFSIASIFEGNSLPEFVT